MGATPLYKRIAGTIRSEILSGAFKPNGRLPTEDQLIEQFQASRNTIRLALGTLANEGIITSTPRRGTFVRERVFFTYNAFPGYERAAADPPCDVYVTQVKGQGRSPSQSLEVSVLKSTAPVAARLNLNEADDILRRRELQSVDGRPWSLLDSYYPMDVAQRCGLIAADNLPGGVIRRLAEHGYDEISYYDEVTGRMPSPEEIALLEIEAGVPVLIHSRTASTSEQPVRLSESVFPADRNRVVYDLDAPR
jgi:GntR family transcriptional regulator